MNPLPQQVPFSFSCQRWRDRRGTYRPPNEVISTHDYEVAPITFLEAKTFVQQHHYSASYVACRFRYGLFLRYGQFPKDQLVGVAVFSMPMSHKVLTNIFPCDVLEAVELGRFVLLDIVPSNAESWFFARCRELLKREGIKGIVAFSDDTPRTSAIPVPSLIFSGHIGTIYQSSNAVYLKRTTRRILKLLPDGTIFSDRTASKIRNAERGWRYAANILVKHGATEPPATNTDDPTALKAWLTHWTTLLTPPPASRRQSSLCLESFTIHNPALVTSVSQMAQCAQSQRSHTTMKVEAIYGSTNPSCDMLNLYDQSTLIARIHDQLWIQHVLGPQQRKRWYNGEYIFNVSTKAIDEHCEKRYAR